jgi:DNA modification methylase
MPRESESLHERVGYKSVIDMGREATVPFPHNLCDYPTKILPQVMGEFVERLSAAGEVVLDPFAGGGTVAVECALRHQGSGQESSCAVSSTLDGEASQITPIQC